MSTAEFQGLLEQVAQLTPTQRQQLTEQLGMLEALSAAHRPSKHPLVKRKQVISKAIFPVAGLGTRFLPATKVRLAELPPIHWPFQSPCFKRPISKLPDLLHVDGWPRLSHTRTFQ